ncbi:DUF3847 domain-containing protein [Eubacterium sp. AF17-7]|jgi:hypothetical protein|uniref:DUF3847 domain-containing protein n=1 Tax=Eubacterium sp. AF17-7 TaxID=2293105 RepID=UPI000E49235F|nr:DUF3847 domain-containing protein [Eubacterium sp. AF17-7]RGG67644.1 DUF3847 domain-containing protein [Eubacterium sp. AF17-7]
MTRRTSEDIQRQIEQLKNQKKEVLAKEKAQARKARTRRLIQRGAILEQYLDNAEDLTNEEIEGIVKYAFNTPYVRDYVKDLNNVKEI